MFEPCSCDDSYVGAAVSAPKTLMWVGWLRGWKVIFRELGWRLVTVAEAYIYGIDLRSLFYIQLRAMQLLELKQSGTQMFSKAVKVF